MEPSSVLGGVSSPPATDDFARELARLRAAGWGTRRCLVCDRPVNPDLTHQWGALATDHDDDCLYLHDADVTCVESNLAMASRWDSNSE